MSSSDSSGGFFQQGVPKDSMVLQYDSNTSALELTSLSKLFQDPRRGKYIQAQEPIFVSKFGLNRRIRLKIDWDWQIKDEFYEQGGAWREVKLTWIQWIRVALGMERTIFVVRRELGMTLWGEREEEIVDCSGPGKRSKGTQTPEQWASTIRRTGEEQVESSARDMRRYNGDFKDQ